MERIQLDFPKMTWNKWRANSQNGKRKVELVKQVKTFRKWDKIRNHNIRVYQ